MEDLVHLFRALFLSIIFGCCVCNVVQTFFAVRQAQKWCETVDKRLDAIERQMKVVEGKQ